MLLAVDMHSDHCKSVTFLTGSVYISLFPFHVCYCENRKEILHKTFTALFLHMLKSIQCKCVFQIIKAHRLNKLFSEIPLMLWGTPLIVPNQIFTLIQKCV